MREKPLREELLGGKLNALVESLSVSLKKLKV